jgi:RNA polymerase sigma-70 factor (ECF subfamily)
VADHTTTTGAAPSDDQELIGRLRAGDEAAFAALIDQYQGSLLRMARSYTRDAALVEEIAQDTWIGLLESLNRFEGRASLKTWLFRIFMNVARARARKESRTVPFSALAADDAADPGRGQEEAVSSSRFAPTWLPRYGGHWISNPARWQELPEEQAISSETQRLIEGAIAGLPEMQRAVVTLRDVEGIDADEVCNLLGLTGTNQRVLLHRARAKVRRALEAQMREVAR